MGQAVETGDILIKIKIDAILSEEDLDIFLWLGKTDNPVKKVIVCFLSSNA